MTQLAAPIQPRIACFSTYVPHQCGLATFAHDLCSSIARESDDTIRAEVLAVADRPSDFAYPAEVRFAVRQHELADYRLLADFVNSRKLDVLLLQHEFGIFGGADGAHLLSLLRSLRIPVVTTLHTILQQPSASQRRVLEAVLDASERVVVMSQQGAETLRNGHRVPDEKIAVVPHGIPDLPFIDPTFYKDKFDVTGRTVLLTFGLLSRGKGIEGVIEALPAVVERHPDVVYVVLGATHPRVVLDEGEAYRQELTDLAQRLGVGDYVRLVDRYVELTELCEYLGAADLYVSSALGEQQAVSGTLAYALGAGKAVVSTPSAYAREMLAEDRGVLVPFRDPAAMAQAINRLLDEEVERQAMRRRGYLYCRQSIWSEIGRQYLELICQVAAQPVVRSRPRSVVAWEPAQRGRALPAVRYDHLLAMSDSVGMLQHAHYVVGDRNHGYCTDDNARALIVALQAPEQAPGRVRRMAARYLSFLHHALHPDTGRFRNFMSYDRRWLEDEGSEDSHGRALAALGKAVQLAPSEGLRASALHVFERALPAAIELPSLRACAFTVYGVDAYLSRYHGDTRAGQALAQLAQRLFERFSLSHAEDADGWMWPEDRLTYANAALPHALLLAGNRLEREEMTTRGLAVLNWLLEVQEDHGVFAPVGSEGWLERGGQRAPFDQQPIEAQVTVEACLEAWRVTGQRSWVASARHVFDWFLGKNVLGQPLADVATGGCRDGLKAGRQNPNQGAESTLAWLLALQAMREVDEELAPISARRAAHAATS